MRHYRQIAALVTVVLALIVSLAAVPAGTHALAQAAQTGVQAEPTASDIIARVHENASFTSAYFESTMIIRTGRRELVKQMQSYSDGQGNGLVTFTNPADRDTKYLKLGDELWMYFPDADDLVKISGHMLRQGFMGSDFSYEDTLESDRFQEHYDVALTGVEACGEATCYVLDAAAKPDAQVTYAQRRMWVDTSSMWCGKEELFAAGGRLLKVAETENVEMIGGRPFATQITMRDVLKQNSSTTLMLTRVEFDIDIPPGLFTLRSLMQ